MKHNLTELREKYSSTTAGHFKAPLLITDTTSHNINKKIKDLNNSINQQTQQTYKNHTTHQQHNTYCSQAHIKHSPGQTARLVTKQI